MKLTRNSIGAILQDDRHPVLTSAIEDIEIEEGIADHVVMDPPYDKRTQSRTRSGKESRSGICRPLAIAFDPMTQDKRRRWALWAATATRKWVAVLSDHESSVEWGRDLEAAGMGMVYVRASIWVRTGETTFDQGQAYKPRKSGAPQFTGDRPAQGHEVVVLAHKGTKMRWNDGGHTAVYVSPIVPPSVRAHETQKPLSLMLDILRDFACAGDVIADPFTGSGTTQVAAKQLGMSSLGIELNAKHAEYARRRIAAARAGQPNEART